MISVTRPGVAFWLTSNWSPNVSRQKMDPSNNTGFCPILPSQYRTTWCMTVNIWLPRYLAYWDSTRCLLTQSVFENYIPAFTNFSYFTRASCQVDSDSPNRMSTRSIPFPRLICLIAHVSRKICADTFFFTPAFSAITDQIPDKARRISLPRVLTALSSRAPLFSLVRMPARRGRLDSRK